MLYICLERVDDSIKMFFHPFLYCMFIQRRLFQLINFLFLACFIVFPLCVLFLFLCMMYSVYIKYPFRPCSFQLSDPFCCLPCVFCFLLYDCEEVVVFVLFGVWFFLFL